MNTNQQHFVIRNHPTEPLQVLRYLGQFIDKWDFGVDLGDKTIRHCNSGLAMNTIIFWKKTPPQKKNRYRLASHHIYQHMTGERTYYFTSNPFSRYMLCVPEVDNHTDDPTRILPFLQLFESHFPGLFYDQGSSGQSLHPYIKLDVAPLYDYYLFESGDCRTYPKFANEVLSQVSVLLRIYGHILAPEHQILCHSSTGQSSKRYDVELDAIKGTYPDYSFYKNKKTGRYIITGVVNHGVLVKLPRVCSSEQCMWLYNSRVYSIIDLLAFSVYVGSCALLSGGLSEEEVNQVLEALTCVEPIAAHSVFFSSRKKNVVASSSCIRETRVKNSNTCIRRSRNQPKNEDCDNLREYDPNANIRRIAIIQRLCREYYTEHQTLPSNDYLIQQYRDHPASTGQADHADLREIEEVCQFVRRTFNPQWCKSGISCHRDMLIPYIKDTFNKKEYRTILAGTAAAKCRPKNILLDLFGRYCLTHLSTNRELTLSTYDGFQGFCANHGIPVSPNMCLACRLLFEHYGWLEKLNADYEMPTYDCLDGKLVKQKGRAMAYTLTPQFPFYDQFEKAVGKKNIEKVRAKGMGSMEGWENIKDAG